VWNNAPYLSRYCIHVITCRTENCTCCSSKDHCITTLNPLLHMQITVNQKSLPYFAGTVNFCRPRPMQLDMCRISKHSGLPDSIYTDQKVFQLISCFCSYSLAAQLIQGVTELDTFSGCRLFKISQAALRKFALVTYFHFTTKKLTFLKFSWAPRPVALI
jgi:hypothetical protein